MGLFGDEALQSKQFVTLSCLRLDGRFDLPGMFVPFRSYVQYSTLEKEKRIYIGRAMRRQSGLSNTRGFVWNREGRSKLQSAGVKKTQDAF